MDRVVDWDPFYPLTLPWYVGFDVEDGVPGRNDLVLHEGWRWEFGLGGKGVVGMGLWLLGWLLWLLIMVHWIVWIVAQY